MQVLEYYSEMPLFNPPPVIVQSFYIRTQRVSLFENVYMFCNTGIWPCPQSWVMMLRKFKLQDLKECGIFCQLPKCACFFITRRWAKLNIYVMSGSVQLEDLAIDGIITLTWYVEVHINVPPPTVPACFTVISSTNFTFSLPTSDMFWAAEYTKHRSMKEGHITCCTKRNNNRKSH